MDRRDVERLQKEVVKLLMSQTESPLEGLAVIAMTHMAVFQATLGVLGSKKQAAEIAAQHLETFLKHFSDIAGKLGTDVEELVMRNLLGGIKDKIFMHDQMDNFKDFVDVLMQTKKKKPAKAGNKKNLQLQVHRDWDFKFPIRAHVRGKVVTLEKSDAKDLEREEVPNKGTQLQLQDEHGNQYWAYYYKNKEEYPLVIDEIREGK